MGFVLGDSRKIDADTTDQFRSAGLSHLLVVSGQNVAFVLVAFETLLKRLGPTTRAGVSMCILACFGVLTRFEPSVLRAGAMAAVVIVSRAAHRPQNSLRTLGIAVGAVLLWDPLLMVSLGFALSVSATAGLAIVAPWLADRFGGKFPDWVVKPVSATVGAQIATYPLLLGLGGTSPASLPANLIALPFAEPLMVFGVLMGVPASFLPKAARTVLLLPCSAALWWITGVARVASCASDWIAAPSWWPVPVSLLVITSRVRRSALFPTPRNALSGQFVSVLMALLVLVSTWAWVGGWRSQINGQQSAGIKIWRNGSAVVAEIVGTLPSDGGRRVLRGYRIRHIDVLVVRRPTHSVWTSLQPIMSSMAIRKIVVCGFSSSVGAVPVLGLLAHETARISTDAAQLWLKVSCVGGSTQVESALAGLNQPL